MNSQCGISQGKLECRFGIHDSTISRYLRKTTLVIIRKRRKAPKIDSELSEKKL